MQLAMKIIWIINSLWLLKFLFCPFEGFKKMPLFEVKLWANGKRTRLHFWMWESSNCVEHTEKENFHFSIVLNTFLRLGRPAPKFRQTCIYIHWLNSCFLQVLNVIFGFLVQKTLPVPIYKVLASLEVILCTIKVIF